MERVAELTRRSGRRSVLVLLVVLAAGLLVAPVHPVEAGTLFGGARQVSAGTWHTCAVRLNGTVWCWGDDSSGQLGDGMTASRTLPVKVKGLADVVAVSAGYLHTCAVRVDGTAWCWGGTPRGQLLTPTRVPNLTSVTHVSVGANADCALRSTGRVWCWGSNYGGELGDGTTTSRLVPGRVIHLSRVVQVSANGFGSFTCARRSDGTVWCWGSNDYGLGDGTTATSRVAPVAVKGLPGPSTDVSVGSAHACARLADGSVWCWGGNGAGGLGDGTRRDRVAATKSLMAHARTVTAGAAGHTCVTTRGHRARCWGYNISGQLGDGTTLSRTAPVAVVELSGVGSIDAGDDHTCAVLSDHTIRCWGQGGSGQLGDGSTVARSVPGPVLE